MSPAQMKSRAGSAGNECSNDKKDCDQISKAREEEHGLNPCLVCEISFHHIAEGRAIASAVSSILKRNGDPQREHRGRMTGSRESEGKLRGNGGRNG